MNEFKTLLIFILALVTSYTWGAELTIPVTFVANQPAIAAEVNSNFSAVEASVDDNNTRLAALETLVETLQTQVAAMNAINLDLETRLAIVESNSVLELDGYLSYALVNGYATAEFSAVNIRLNNGRGTTDGFINGLGNLTIGYNEPSNSTVEFCSDPQYVTQAACEAGAEIWARNVRRGSHNFIIGLRNSYDNFASVLIGTDQISNANYSNLIGGSDNMNNGINSVIVGGSDHVINGASSVISGGDTNVVDGNSSSITGGSGNEAIGFGTSITGGIYNKTYDFYSNITGGRRNIANGRYAHISGGDSNTASGEASSISGGNSRTATGIDDWAAGSLSEDF